MVNPRSPYIIIYSVPVMEGTVKIDIFLKSLRQNNFGVFGSSGGRTS